MTDTTDQELREGLAKAFYENEVENYHLPILLWGELPEKERDKWGQRASVALAYMKQHDALSAYRDAEIENLRSQLIKAKDEADGLRDSLKYKWQEGLPPKWFDESFIVETTYGDRVVLKRLPEEYAYDYTTADGTYLKADKIKRWMQFPDSVFVPLLSDVEALRSQLADCRAVLKKRGHDEGCLALCNNCGRGEEECQMFAGSAPKYTHEYDPSCPCDCGYSRVMGHD